MLFFTKTRTKCVMNMNINIKERDWDFSFVVEEKRRRYEEEERCLSLHLRYFCTCHSTIFQCQYYIIIVFVFSICVYFFPYSCVSRARKPVNVHLHSLS